MIKLNKFLSFMQIKLNKIRGVAQLVARLLWEQDVGGSSPFTPTTGSADPQLSCVVTAVFSFLCTKNQFVKSICEFRGIIYMRKACDTSIFYS